MKLRLPPVRLFFSTLFTFGQLAQTPIMHWRNWNNFRINITEKLIYEQSDGIVLSSLFDAGYRFINMGDGCFGGRETSILLNYPHIA